MLISGNRRSGGAEGGTGRPGEGAASLIWKVRKGFTGRQGPSQAVLGMPSRQRERGAEAPGPQPIGSIRATASTAAAIGDHLQACGHFSA